MKAADRIILIIASVSLLATSSFGQTGSDSPGGAAGGYNGQVTTGCSYDAYSGNATRAITDIVVAGSVGAYPLTFTRYANSRYAIGFDDYGNGLNPDLGPGASWTHSYQWAIDSTTKNVSDGKPKKFTVRYPDSRVIAFSASTNGDPYRRGGQAVADRLNVVWDSSSAGHADLIMPDGGYVHFAIAITYGGTNGGWAEYDYTVQSITDPYGQTTTITGSPASGLVTITEPAGRWLKLHYINFGDPNWPDRVIYQVEASDGRTVQYYYGRYDDGTDTFYTVLTNVVYYGDSNLTATYTYQGVGGNPLLNTCIDPMYAGAMWKIAYKFAQGTNADGKTQAVPGQILSENYFDGTTIGPAVSTLSVDNSDSTHPKRTETRGDGPSRNFTYGAARLKNWTDYKGNAASETYDNNGFVKTVTDFTGLSTHTTTIQRDPYTGVVTKITYPSTSTTSCPTCTGAGFVSYVYGTSTCADANNRGTAPYDAARGPNDYNAYYLYSATDEANNPPNTVTRDLNKRVTHKQYADNGTEDFTYNSFGEVLTHRGTTGGLETNTYDGRGLLTQYREPYHLSTADPNNPSVPTTTFPTTLYTYDGFDRVYKLTTFSLNAADNTRTTTYHYNSRGDIDTTTLPTDPVDGQQHTISKVIDPMSGTVRSTADQLFHTTNFSYDTYRRLRTTTTPPRYSGDTMNHTSLVYYDANGSGDDYTHTDANVTYAIMPSGKKTVALYDENKRKVSVTAAPGTGDTATTTFEYDTNGNLTSVVSPKEQAGQQYAGQSTTTNYDERNRPYSVRDPLGNVTSSTFDSGGRKKTVTRANGQLTTFDTFDAMNRVLQSTVKQTPDPDAVTKYNYYNSGLLATMKDPRLVANNSIYGYVYQYDLMGRKTILTYPPDSGNVQRTEQWHFDDHNRLDTFTNRNGNTQRTTYDSFDRPNNVAWDDSGLTPTVTFGYDIASRVTAINNANANVLHAYFNDGLLSSETTTITGDNVARTISYSYDADANRASIQYPNNAYSFNYSYTNRNQLSDLGGAHFAYDVDGNLTTRTPGNSTTSSYIYDGLDRIMSITHTLNGTTRTFGYAYDSVGNRKWVKRDGGTGDVFGYDLADQSTSVLLNVSNPDTTSPGSQTIHYDANGNRTTFSPYGTTDTYTTNNLNQYTQRNSSTAGYDTKGNMTTGFDGSTNTFDAQDRILTGSKSGASYTFKYDGLNRQVSRQIGAGSPVYNVYDGWNLIAEYAAGSTSPSAAYLPELKILTTNRYYYQDASGSTSHLTDSTGHLLEWYRYDLQGTPVVYNANNQQQSTPPSVRHLFTGQQWYNELGLYDLRNRFYSSDIGRFLQPDPLGFGGDATNLYRYCTNNPVSRRDPNGLQATGLPLEDPGFYEPDPLQPNKTIDQINFENSWRAGQNMRAITDAIVDYLDRVLNDPLCEHCDSDHPLLLDLLGTPIIPVAIPSEDDSEEADSQPQPSGPPAPLNASFYMSFYVGEGSAISGFVGPAWQFGTARQLGIGMPRSSGYSLSVGTGHAIDMAVAFALDPANRDPLSGPDLFAIHHSPAVAEGASAGNGASGPQVAHMPAPQMYASGWKWQGGLSGSGYIGGHPHGYVAGQNPYIGHWVPTGWTTDPALAVPMPTGKKHGPGRGGTGPG